MVWGHLEVKAILIMFIQQLHSLIKFHTWKETQVVLSLWIIWRSSRRKWVISAQIWSIEPQNLEDKGPLTLVAPLKTRIKAAWNFFTKMFRRAKIHPWQTDQQILLSRNFCISFRRRDNWWLLSNMQRLLLSTSYSPQLAVQILLATSFCTMVAKEVGVLTREIRKLQKQVDSN